MRIARLFVMALLAALFSLGWGGAALRAAPSQQDVGSRLDAMIAGAKAEMLLDPQQAAEQARAAETVARLLPGRRGIVGRATAQWLQGEAYLRLDDSRRAGPLIDSALAAIAQAGPPTKLNGDMLLSRGGVDTARADVAAALSDYQRAHDIFRDLGETRSRAVALVSIALLYQEAKDNQNALKYYKQSLDVYQGDPQLLFSVYNNRGNAFKDIKRYVDADRQYAQALKIARQLKSSVQEARVLRNIARNQIEAGQPRVAARTVAAGLSVARDQDAAETRKEFWILSAQLAMQRGEIAQATALVNRTFEHVDLAHTMLDMREAHQTAYEVFKRTGDDALALAHLEALKRLDDQTSTLAASTNTALAAARFDFANQELRIAKLRNEELAKTNAYERAQARTQRAFFIVGSIGALVIVMLLAVGIVTVQRGRNEVRAANIDLAATNRALEKALAAKTEFLATTSHEIRTPLNGILGMTQVMLADRTLGETLRDRIGIVHGAGITMRALVDDILDVAKMETGNLSVEQVPFDLKEMLRDVSRMWCEQAEAKGLAFSLDLDSAPDHIEGDPTRLRQIVFNLLSNALKFTASGSVGLAATTRAGAGGERVVIAVRDSGIGIPAEKHELVFESFRQVDAGTTRRFGGTGLGLSIVRNLARAMGGDVRVESVEGTGSTFTIDLPLHRATPPEAAAVGAGEGGLLIVDRNPITRSMLRAVLQPRAETIVFAGSAEDAVARIAEGGIAQVLIDDGTIKAAEDMAAALAVIVEAANRHGASTTLLWAAVDTAGIEEMATWGLTRLVSKPIAGAQLLHLMYGGHPGDRPACGLVTQAA